MSRPLRKPCPGVLEGEGWHYPHDDPGCRFCFPPPRLHERIICALRGHDDDTDHPLTRFCMRCRRFHPGPEA